MMVGIRSSSVREALLPIPDSLNDQNLRFDCPRCRHPVIRKGSWFKVIATFRCPGCKAALRLGYPEKLRIFEAHKQLTERANQ